MKTNRYANVRYYHCMPFDFVSFAEIDADPERTEDEGCRLAFRLLEQQIGFYPIFLACGEQNASVITGYSDQWRAVACEIWVRNHSTARAMGALGFENVVVKRVPIAEKSF